jgi:hypothetical protein
MPTRKPSTAVPSSAKRPANRPPHEPTKVDRDTVSVMVAALNTIVLIEQLRALTWATLRPVHSYP